MLYTVKYVLKISPLTKMDEKSPVALPLILRHGHNTRHIVLLLTMLLLREIADEVASFAVILRQHIEEEGFNVVV